jgi:hypothetical protein
VSFSGRDQPFVDGLQLGVPIEGGRQRRCVKALPQSLTSPFDVSRTTAQAAIIVLGSKAGDGRGLFACDVTDLGHAHQNGDRGSQADAVHADNQVEPVG